MPIRSALRAAAERAGYVVTHRSVLPFGVDPLWDIQRLGERHSAPIHTAFDIGAHTGQTSQSFLDAFPQASIYAFEPHPNSFNCIQAMKADRLIAHQVAMSDRCGEATFFVFDDIVDPSKAVAASMNNSLVKDRQFALVAGSYSKSITVDCTTVDAFCSANEINRLDLLKIDTEGHEVAVLEGARETLANRGVRFVFLEYETVLPIPNAQGGALGPAAALLEPLGFRLVASYPNTMVDRPLYASFNALFLAPRSM